MAKRNSMLDTIAKATAHTVVEVSKAYHHKEPEEQTEKNVKENSSLKPVFFPFGTSFSNITKFTSEVEVFTKHIDSFSRKHSQKEKDIRGSQSSSDAQKGEK